MCATGPEERERRVLNCLSGTHLLPSTDRHIAKDSITLLYSDPFPNQFLRWKTAENRLSRRIEVILQEKQGANKQEGIVRTLHEEERCRFIVVS